MSNSYFKFKQFTIEQQGVAMKVGTDGVLLGAWADVGVAQRALDIGTGTGVIALMLAQRSAQLMVDAVEIDGESAQQAQRNFDKSGWASRLALHNVAFQDFASAKGACYDLIVSNPPYFCQSLKSPNEGRTLARHAYSLPFEELLTGVGALLLPGGAFCGIFPYTEGNVFIAKASSYGLFCTKKLNICSKPHHSVIRMLVQMEFARKPIDDRTLIIHTLDGDYTDDYKKLTADFYLSF